MNESGGTIVVIGAGIAGLAAAWKLRSSAPQANVVVVEASGRAGGILQTHSESGYVVDHAADMFTTEPNDALLLVRALGHEDKLQTTNQVARRAYVATENSIEPVPQGFSLMLPADLDAIRNTNILDEDGIARVLSEIDVPPSTDWVDEDFQSFAVRRFGQQAFDRLIQPLVSGIYTANPSRLSMNATMKRFVDMERNHGSLIAAAQASKTSSADHTASGARYDLFRAPRDGMGSLVQWLSDEIREVDVRYDWPVEKLELTLENQWQIFSRRSNSEPICADAVIIACPIAAAAGFFSSVSSQVSSDMSRIESASCAVVSLGFDQKQLRQPFEGYGIVVPAILGRKLIAASFASNKFPGRAPDGKVLVRCFVGGALQGELVDLSDRQLIDLAFSELDKLIGVSGLPEFDYVCRWRNAMPQYHVGHLDRIQSIEQQVAALPAVALAGNAYHGVGVPVCIRSGIDAASRIAQTYLNTAN